MIRFCREASLLGPACNAHDLVALLHHMRAHHINVARKAQRDHRARRRAEAATAASNEATARYLAHPPGPPTAQVALLLDGDVGPYASARPEVNRLGDPAAQAAHEAIATGLSEVRILSVVAHCCHAAPRPPHPLFWSRSLPL